MGIESEGKTINKKLTYTEIVIFIITLVLFTNNHLLYVILSNIEGYWFGIRVNLVLVDFVLYLAIFLQSIGILILFEEKIKLYREMKKNSLPEPRLHKTINFIEEIDDR